MPNHVADVCVIVVYIIDLLMFPRTFLIDSSSAITYHPELKFEEKTEIFRSGEKISIKKLSLIKISPIFFNFLDQCATVQYQLK